MADSRRIVAFAVTLIFLTLFAIPIVRADPVQPITSTFQVTGLVTLDVRITDDGNTILIQKATVVLTGDMTGTVDCDVVVTIDSATLKGTLHAIGTFTGTVLGRLGTLVGRENAHFDLVAGTFESQITFFEGTGELEGITGGAKAVGLGTGTISGNVHFPHA